MTALDLTKFRALAEGATRGPWRVNRFDHDDGNINWQVQSEVAAEGFLGEGAPVLANLVESDFRTARLARATACYIAAMSPDVVLALIDELTTWRNRADVVPAIPIDPEAQAMVDKMAAEAEASLSGSRKVESVAALRAERDSARAEVARLRKLFEELSVSSGYYHGTDAGSMPVEPSDLVPLLQRGFREHHAEIDTNVRIRAEVARLRGALTEIAEHPQSTGLDAVAMKRFARTALDGKDGETLSEDAMKPYRVTGRFVVTFSFVCQAHDEDHAREQVEDTEIEDLMECADGSEFVEITIVGMARTALAGKDGET